jgi:hypothetical protein
MNDKKNVNFLLFLNICSTTGNNVFFQSQNVQTEEKETTLLISSLYWRCLCVPISECERVM